MQPSAPNPAQPEETESIQSVDQAFNAVLSRQELHTQQLNSFAHAFAALLAGQKRMEATLDQLIQFAQKEEKQMAALDDRLATLTAEVAAETTVDQSAITLINGVPGLVSAAVAEALAAGATPAQLASFDALNVALASQTTALAASVTAGTGTTVAPPVAAAGSAKPATS